VRHHQSRYLFGIGATLLLSGTAILLTRPQWDLLSAVMVAGGLVSWLVGWRKTD
jgi:ubiquinone biosynthesis protein